MSAPNERVAHDPVERERGHFPLPAEVDPGHDLRRLVLLDLDTMCSGDPAYDVGHFLGQLERRCTLDDTLPGHARDWVDGFLRAYPMASHGVSARNVSVYRGVTLFRKMYTLCSRDPVMGPRRAVRLAERARAALEAALPRTERRIA